MRKGANMRLSSLASAISAFAILWSGVVYGAVAPDRDWDWCNGTVDGGIPYDAQIAGCAARIQSGQESATNLFVAYYNRGFAYYNKGDYGRAILDYTEAAKLKPAEANVFVGRGLAHFHQGQYEPAIGDFSEAIRLKPDNFDAHNQRAPWSEAAKKIRDRPHRSDPA